MGYEALIRGPQGSTLEPPTVLFAVAHENEMDVELETLCLETIFAGIPRAVGDKRLFVNASAMLLRHPVFLEGRYDTGFIEQHMDGGKGAPEAAGEPRRAALMLAAIAAYRRDKERAERSAHHAPQDGETNAWKSFGRRSQMRGNLR